MDRPAALTLINSWIKSPNLIKHMLSVEAVMPGIGKPTHRSRKGRWTGRFNYVEPNLGLSIRDFVGLCLSGLQSISVDLGL